MEVLINKNNIEKLLEKEITSQEYHEMLSYALEQILEDEHNEFL